MTEAKPRDHTRVSIQFASTTTRVGACWATDSEQLRCMQQTHVDNHTATTGNPIILSDWREEEGMTYLNLTVVISPFNLPCTIPLLP
jgi:hypothetical protein